MNTENVQINQSKAQNCIHMIYLVGNLQRFMLTEKASLDSFLFNAE